MGNLMHSNESSHAGASPRPLINAATREGHMLPVIDIDDPRFAVADDPDNLGRLMDASMEEERRRRRLPKFLLRWMIRSAAKRSRLVRALFYSDATFLDGISTYVMKLGADNLPPPYDNAADRRVAASPHLVLLRLRTQQVAQLLADALVSDLEHKTFAPLHLINIAGGTAIDSLNALMMLSRRKAGLLHRPVVIHVLDQDDAGPFFGRNALAALMRHGGPLADLDITFDHRPYNWDDTAALAALLREVNASKAVVAASSEGALFEYGTDEAIVANLSALRCGGVTIVVGSVTSSDEAHRRMIAVNRFRLFPRGLEGFIPLAERGGYKIVRAKTNQFGEQVLLGPA